MFTTRDNTRRACEHAHKDQYSQDVMGHAYSMALLPVYQQFVVSASLSWTSRSQIDFIRNSLAKVRASYVSVCCY